MTPLILGGGFIGSTLHQRHPNWHLITRQAADLQDPESTADAVANGVPWVVTAAVTRLVDNTGKGRSANVAIAKAVAAAIETSLPSHLIFLSTCDVYGVVEEGATLHEGVAPCPVDPYAESKLDGEKILAAACDAHDVPYTIFRLPGVYGASQLDKSVVTTMVRSALRHQQVVVYGEGNQRRDFVYVEEVCRLIEKAIAEAITGCYNVATGKSYPIGDIAAMVAQAVGPQVAVTHEPPPPGLPMRSPSLRFNTTKLVEAFGPIASFPESLAAYRHAVAEHASASWA